MPLRHLDPKWDHSSGHSAFMGGVSPVLYRLVVPARPAKIHSGVQILGGRTNFHHFLWKLKNSISAPKCPITEPKICIWSLLLSKFSYHTHSLQNGGHPRLLARLSKSVHNLMGGGGGGCEGEEVKRRPAALLIASGGGGASGEGEGQVCPCDWLHSTYILFSLPSLFLISPSAVEASFDIKRRAWSLTEPKNRFQGMNPPAYVAWRAGTITLFLLSS